MVKTILIVDDERDMRRIMQMALESAGYIVITAKDGVDCLKKLEVVKPDLVLLDIIMPGIPVDEILPKLGGTKIVYLTVMRPEQLKEKGLLKTKNIVGIVQKPFDLNALLLKVRSIIGQADAKF